MGTRQSGLLDLKISNLVKDSDILILARKYAQELLQKDPKIEISTNKPVKNFYLINYAESLKWGRIS